MDNDTLKKELTRCLGCKASPCAKACPLGLSPHDFIAYAKEKNYKQAALIIANKNPLPETCGFICPEMFCQKACIRNKIDTSVEIPCLQKEIMEKAGLPELTLPPKINRKAAIIGGGPAGLGALFELITNGWEVDIYEKSSALGGAIHLIPASRLPKEILNKEIARLVENNRTTVYLNTEITDFNALNQTYDGVVLALGEPTSRTLGIKGEEHAVSYKDFLKSPTRYLSAQISKIAVCGGGEVALDCAITACANCQNVEMFVRRKRSDMRIGKKGFAELEKHNITVRELTSITEITKNNASCRLTAVQNEITSDGKAAPCPETQCELKDYNLVIKALGSYYPKENIPDNFIIAGDMTGQTGTVVQALASGRAAAKKIISLKEQER